jgi:hydrophobe/amphiphile efflux-1 (HAE1) family protein
MAKFFINRPIFAIVLGLVIMIAGGLCIPSLPVAQFPQITPPTVEVEINYPGANAEEVEKSIAAVVEPEVNGAENMIYFSSKSSNDGRYLLLCTFAVGTDLDLANVDINNRVNKASPKLPPEAVAAGISIKKKSPDMLLVVSLYSPDRTYDETYLSNYASINLVDAIARTPGVGSTMIIGQRDYAMRLWVRPDRLTKLGLTASDMAQVIREQNVLAPAGALGQPPAKAGVEFQYAVKVKGRLTKEKEFENMVIRSLPDGSILRVKDLARTELAAKTYTSYGRLNGVPATLIIVYQLPGANAIDTANKLYALLDQLKADFPPGIAYQISFDNTTFVRVGIKEVLENLFEAILLVLLVIYIFLGSLRPTLIPMTTVPVALFGTFVLFVPLGFSVNTLTLFALVLAVGNVVDDSVVLVEAIELNIGRGMEPKKAAETAMEQLSGALVASTLVQAAVFIPAAFMGGITGQLYRQFALTLAGTMFISTLMALTLSPALCAMILKPRKETRGLLGRFLRGFNYSFDGLSARYSKVIGIVLRRTVLMLVLLLAFVIVTGGFLKVLPTSFVPDEDQGYFYAALNLPDGASLERTEALTNRAEKFLQGLPGVKEVVTFGGLNVLTNAYTSNNATLIVILKPWGERTSSETKLAAIMAKARQEFGSYPEALAIVFVPPPIPGLGSAGGFQFELQDRGGRTPAELDQTARTFINVAAQRPELINLFTGFRATVPQIELDLDRDKAKTLGVPINNVFESLQIYLGGLQVNDFNLFGRTYKVMLQAEPEFRASPENLKQIYMRNAGGTMVPITTLVQIKSTTGPDLIQRYNMYRTAEINGAPAPGYSSGQALAAMEQVAAANLPQGFGHEWTGTAFQEKQAGGAQAAIFILGLLFVFLFLAAQYESWSIPFSILLAVPLGIFGAFLGIWLRGLVNDVYVQVGLLMLIGLSAKNAILVVEYAKELYEEGRSVYDAAFEASSLRFRPIMMTAISSNLGNIPLVVATGAGALARNSLGTAVFAGYLVATVLGVFFVPVLYYAITKLSEKLFVRHAVLLEGEPAAAVITGREQGGPS